MCTTHALCNTVYYYQRIYFHILVAFKNVLKRIFLNFVKLTTLLNPSDRSFTSLYIYEADFKFEEELIFLHFLFVPIFAFRAVSVKLARAQMWIWLMKFPCGLHLRSLYIHLQLSVHLATPAKLKVSENYCASICHNTNMQKLLFFLKRQQARRTLGPVHK